MRRTFGQSAVVLAACTLCACFTPRQQAAVDAGPQVVACSPACGETDVCVDGACLPRTCERVSCLTGSVCVRGHCYPSACGAGPCADGFVCAGSQCVEQACAGVSCPFGTCVDGGCPACSALEYFEPDAGACAVKKTSGSSCAGGGQCGSGFCTGGICCDRPCDAPCEQCGDGRCALRAALDPGGPPQCFPGRCSGRSRSCNAACSDDPDCASGAFCKAGLNCQTALGIGATCTRDTMCSSGHCAGGICCDSACNGSCQSCDALVVGDAGYPAGTCHPVGTNNIFFACSPMLCQPTLLGCPTNCVADLYCGFNTFCGDDGGCSALLGLTQTCSRNAQCATGNCRNGHCCAAGCTGACKDCQADGSCQAKANGVADAGCAGAGVCAQGVCCDKPCTGQCERCDTTQHLGTCTGVTGTDYVCNTYYSCNGDAGCALVCGAGGQPCAATGFCNPNTRTCDPACDDLVCITTRGPSYCCGNDNLCHNNQICSGI